MHRNYAALYGADPTWMGSGRNGSWRDLTRAEKRRFRHYIDQR